MLYITRKIDEEIYIGSVRIVVADLRSREVRLGIDAPQEVKILRGELKRKEHGGANVSGRKLPA